MVIGKWLLKKTRTKKEGGFLPVLTDKGTTEIIEISKDVSGIRCQ
jgi:hypothetical protein